MKKVLSVLLALMMVTCFTVSAIPVLAVDAADDAAAVSAGNYFRVGEAMGSGYYATFKDALNAANNGDTIHMLADYAAGTEKDVVVSKNLTIDGGNHKLTASGYFLHFKATDGTVTVQNLNYESSHGFRCYTVTSSVIFDHVNATVTGGLFVNLQEDSGKTGTGIVTIRNSKVTSKTTGEPIALLQGSNRTLVVEDSTLARVGTMNGRNENNAVINMAGTNPTVRLEAGAVVTSAYTAGNNGMSSCIAFGGGTNSPNVVLESGSKLTMESEISHANNFIWNDNAKGTVRMEDNGCTYVVGKAVATRGVIMPKLTSVGGENCKAEFVSGDTTVAGDNFWFDRGATGAVSFTARKAVDQTVTEDDTQVAAGKYFRIGEGSTAVYYDNLKTALEAAMEGQTVTMIKGGYRYTATTQIEPKADSVTFDGNGYWMYTNLGYAFKILVNNFILKNLSCYATGQFMEFNPKTENMTLTLEHLSASSHGGLMLNGARGNCVEGSSGIINIKDSVLVTANTAEEIVLLRIKVHETLNIENSTLWNHGTANGHAFAIQSDKEAGYRREINITGNSLIHYTGTQKATLIFTQNGTNTAVNIGENVVLRMDDTAAGALYIEANSKLNDNGATYVANAKAVKNGIVLPTVVLKDGQKLLGFTVNDNALTAGGTYQKADANADFTFKAVSYNSADFVNVKGASIRTAAPYGIRFTAQVSSELYAQLHAIDSNVTFGIIVAPTRRVIGNFDISNMAASDYKMTECTKWSKENENGIYEYRLALYDIEESKNGFTTDLSATAYFIIHFEDGSTQTIFVEYSAEENSRSLYDVAKAAYADGVTDSSIINNIIAVSEAG